MYWAIVTGATSPIGRAITLQLAKAGYNIVIHYHLQHDKAIELKHTCEALGSQVFIGSASFIQQNSVEHFIQTLKHKNIHCKILINNASIYQIGSVIETNANEWDAIFQANLHAPLQLVKAFREEISLHEGSIINLGVAGLGKNRANSYNSAYFCAKEAFWCATRSLAKELAPSKINVNMVSPGHMEFSQDLEKFQHKLLMGRAGKAEEIAEVVRFLIRPETKYVTGQNIEVDGGAFL